jgi:predicted Zn-dependent peptidase
MIIWAGTEKSKVKEVKKICLDEFKKMGEITEKELEEGKQQVMGNFDVMSESSDETARNLIMEQVADEAEEYYKYKDKIMDVSLDDIKKLAQKTEYSSFVLSP